MDDTPREALRRRLQRGLEALDRLGPTRHDKALQPVPVTRYRPPRIRPIRAWSRLIRI